MKTYRYEPEEYSLRDGRTVILRTPKISDLNDLLKYINSLVDEDAMILLDKKMNKKDEKKWLMNEIKTIKEGPLITFVAEIDYHAIGMVNLSIGKYKESHLGTIGMGIVNGYRDLGLGRIMLNKIIKEAKKRKLKLLHIAAFSKNHRALHLYRSIGFKDVGIFPKRIRYKNGYDDEVIMFMKL